jgi:hypothetical protein
LESARDRADLRVEIESSVRRLDDASALSPRPPIADEEREGEGVRGMERQTDEETMGVGSLYVEWTPTLMTVGRVETRGGE